MGITTYGYVPTLPMDLVLALKEMKNSYEIFAKYVERRTEMTITNDPSTTAEAIHELNVFRWRNRANCLVFISAQRDSWSLPLLDPQHANFQRIVAVGYSKADLSKMVKPPRGLALEKHFNRQQSFLLLRIINR
ncbi:hypothetical protein RB195_020984 [Necator americanus]